MTDQPDRRDRAAAPRAADARQDRLKAALRENLKRRKQQTRERGKLQEPPTDDTDASPNGEVGKLDE